jgi:hypothetical protein
MRDFLLSIFIQSLYVKYLLTNGTTEWTKKNNFGQRLFQTLQ